MAYFYQNQKAFRPQLLPQDDVDRTKPTSKKSHRNMGIPMHRHINIYAMQSQAKINVLLDRACQYTFRVF